MSNRDDDIKQLKACLTWAETNEQREAELQWDGAFASMLVQLESGRFQQLTEKQRLWVHGVHERLFDEPQYENAWSAGKVPRGSYGKTPTPEVLKTLPKKPPKRA